MLAHLYHDLYHLVYQGLVALLVGVTLLQIWAWEHLDFTCPLSHKARPMGRPYVYGYLGVVVQWKLGKLEY